jgi:3-phenylpropionate/trans-cinnamate dioxygenase ferredoxin subunit
MSSSVTTSIGRESPATEFHAAAPVSKVPDGGILGVEVAGTKIILSNLGGEIHAVSGVCTHEDFDLADGIVIEDAVTCPLHLSQFDLRTGQVYNPPATEPLKVFNVKIDGDTVFVEV